MFSLFFFSTLEEFAIYSENMPSSMSESNNLFFTYMIWIYAVDMSISINICLKTFHQSFGKNIISSIGMTSFTWNAVIKVMILVSEYKGS